MILSVLDPTHDSMVQSPHPIHLQYKSFDLYDQLDINLSSTTLYILIIFNQIYLYLGSRNFSYSSNVPLCRFNLLVAGGDLGSINKLAFLEMVFLLIGGVVFCTSAKKLDSMNIGLKRLFLCNIFKSIN